MTKVNELGKPRLSVEIDSLYHACIYAQELANATGLQTAIYQPRFKQFYCVALGRHDVEQATTFDNFVDRFVPE